MNHAYISHSDGLLLLQLCTAIWSASHPLVAIGCEYYGTHSIYRDHRGGGGGGGGNSMNNESTKVQNPRRNSYAVNSSYGDTSVVYILRMRV